jgi:hypothetical protein
MWKAHDLEKRDKRRNSNGYFEAWYPEHPRNVEGWVLVHRLVMENHIQRYLTLDEVVHHVNEHKECNEIWNLFLTDESEHTFIHRLGHRHRSSTRRKMSESHKKIAQNRVRGPDGKFAQGPLSGS